MNMADWIQMTTKIAALESRIAMLEAKVRELESAPAPAGAPARKTLTLKGQNVRS